MKTKEQKPIVPKGRVLYEVGGTPFIVDEKYEVLKQIGSGAYGVVASALDRQRNKKVAIKKVLNAFDDLIDAKRIVREIKLLSTFYTKQEFFKH
jgi:mitogen-activated protein kinase 1/3